MKKLFTLTAGLVVLSTLAGCSLYKSNPTTQSGTVDTGAANQQSMDHTKHTNNGKPQNHADMVQSEFDFIYLMIPHHQEAVGTSKALLQVTKNPQLIALASGIVAGQTAEVDMMKGWLNQWYSGMKYEGIGYMPMMRDTSAISAEPTIEKMWTEDMIAHHQGAIDMANKLIEIMNEKDQFIKTSPAGKQFRDDLRMFADQVIRAQTKEINQMKQMLATK